MSCTNRDDEAAAVVGSISNTTATLPHSHHREQQQWQQHHNARRRRRRHVQHARALRSVTTNATSTSPTTAAAAAAEVAASLSCTSLQRSTRRLQRCVRALSSFCDAVPAVVQLRVGGRVFAVHRQLLLRDPQSLLFALVERHYAAARRAQRQQQQQQCTLSSSSSLPPVDLSHRDADVFARLLNVLRGYRHAVTPPWRDACRREAAYYGLSAAAHTHSATTTTMTSHTLCADDNDATTYFFRPPAYGARLYADMVCCFASGPLTTGLHTIHLAVTQSERVGVGVMRSDAEGRLRDGDGVRQLCGSALYWSDGRVTMHFPRAAAATTTTTAAAATATAHTTAPSSPRPRAEPPPPPQTMDTGWPYPSPVVVRVVWDADALLVRWLLNDDCCVAVQRLPRYDTSSSNNNDAVRHRSDGGDDDTHSEHATAVQPPSSSSSAPLPMTYAFFVVAARNSHVSIVTPP